MKRRVFVTGFAGLLAAPLAAGAQQAAKTPRVVVQWGLPLDRVLAVRRVGAFDTRLHDLGWENGRNIRVEHRGSDGTLGQLQTAAAQVGCDRGWGTVSAVAMGKATTALPVVFLAVGVPVEIGLVASLSRPGGNNTGVTFEAAKETYGKRRQLLNADVSHLFRVRILFAFDDSIIYRGVQAPQTGAS